MELRLTTEQAEKYFYVQINMYGSESSFGFSNTWKTVALKTESDRAEYVYDNSDNVSCEAISLEEARKNNRSVSVAVKCHYGFDFLGGFYI